MSTEPLFISVRKVGFSLYGLAFMLVTVMGIYGLFADSAFLVWNKTREEILRCYFTFFGALLLWLLGFYVVDFSNKMEAEFDNK